jgi:hypothetical protein
MILTKPYIEIEALWWLVVYPNLWRAKGIDNKEEKKEGRRRDWNELLKNRLEMEHFIRGGVRNIGKGCGMQAGLTFLSGPLVQHAGDLVFLFYFFILFLGEYSFIR